MSNGSGPSKKKKARADFSPQTKKLLCDSVRGRCCICLKDTGWYNVDKAKFTTQGEAAHIIAAADGGARADPSKSEEVLRSQSNGLWLCCNCHTLADKAASEFSVEALVFAKKSTEYLANSDSVDLKTRTVAEFVQVYEEDGPEFDQGKTDKRHIRKPQLAIAVAEGQAVVRTRVFKSNLTGSAEGDSGQSATLAVAAGAAASAAAAGGSEVCVGVGKGQGLVEADVFEANF